MQKELMQYIREALQQGHNKETIRNHLINKGYDEVVINKTIKEALFLLQKEESLRNSFQKKDSIQKVIELDSEVEKTLLKLKDELNI